MAAGGRRLAATPSVIRQLTRSLLFLLSFPALGSGQQQSLEKVLRLKAGNFWMYHGTVEWTTAETPEHKSTVQKKQITWKSEIVEESVHGPLKAYLVHGSLADLQWYDPDKQPGDYLWIVYQGRFYALGMDSGWLRRFHDPKDGLMDLINAEDPVIELPFRVGKCTDALHPAEERVRNDLLYCWHAESLPKRFVQIKNVPSQTVKPWRLVYRTNPEDEALTVASTIGFTGYRYSHHGTVSEAHMELVEAHLQ